MSVQASEPALIVCYHTIISLVFRHNLIGKKGGCHVLWVQTSVLLEAKTRFHLAICVSSRGMHPIFVLDWSDTSDKEKGMPIQFLGDFLQPVIVNAASSYKASCFVPSNMSQVTPQELYVSG